MVVQAAARQPATNIDQSLFNDESNSKVWKRKHQVLLFYYSAAADCFVLFRPFAFTVLASDIAFLYTNVNKL